MSAAAELGLWAATSEPGVRSVRIGAKDLAPRPGTRYRVPGTEYL